MASVRFLKSDERAIIAECGNVFILLAMHQEAPETFALAEGHVHSLVGRNPRGIGFLFLIDHAEGPPPGFIDRVRSIHLGIEPELVAVACVVLPQGFAASIYRSTGAAYIALAGKRSLLHMCGDTGSGVAWLTGRLADLPGSPSPEELTAAAEAVLGRRPVTAS